MQSLNSVTAPQITSASISVLCRFGSSIHAVFRRSYMKHVETLESQPSGKKGKIERSIIFAFNRQKIADYRRDFRAPQRGGIWIP
jgi:hypothetical protein